MLFSGGIKTWLGEFAGGIFPGEGGMSKSLASGGDSPHFPSRENPVIGSDMLKRKTLRLKFCKTPMLPHQFDHQIIKRNLFKTSLHQ